MSDLLQDAPPRIRSAAGFDTIEYATAQLAAGRAIIVVDNEDRENEGDFVFAAELATPELVGFVIRYSSGVLCVPLPGADCDRLELPPMYHVNQDRKGTAYTVSVDARDGVTTGISAAERAVTLRALADPTTTADGLSRPGHVFPLRSRDGGVLVRPGHTEAAVDLAQLAGLRPAGGICEVVNDDGSMSRLPELQAFAAEHDLALISIADLVAFRRAREVQIRKVAQARLPLPQGLFQAHGYLSTVTGRELIGLVHGELGDGEDVLVRVHSECLTGDVLGSLRCDCGPQLHTALDAVVAEGRGVVLYIRGHEGRGIGLLDKLRAYELQDEGADTVDANLALGLPSDSREYGTGAQVLADLGIRSMRLLTNNPAKRAGLEGYGLTVLGRVPLAGAPNPENLRYLTTKRDRMGHVLDGDLGGRLDQVVPGGSTAGDPTPAPGDLPDADPTDPGARA
ncbi:3,4-dihydroxy 2-butanone 4-phosphate synthase/GTP cyclohydrolase II [Nakamurella flavida]|uniref:bifunctional 3,4-dihydroxy-2-butanone-4-phosphate synthase/GTP cyclohydrolase II n=1 Tax=Nakamurella flavida TaxID=363630 RepID=UPI00278AA339|nr:bifunctional 3,4-dihydroxy-2-butanone-4-phosphate synthase/GTP cyclohydrolase II [Nakamurella flavida]MDP9777626.1 3,4-dihydroxy 2-butanone 4-phosphate synthase/GTP cyclohydrolase II [Nakamurella flavida]